MGGGLYKHTLLFFVVVVRHVFFEQCMNGYGCSFIYIIIDHYLVGKQNNNDSFVVQLTSHALPAPGEDSKVG